MAIPERRDILKERLTIHKRGQITLPKSVLDRFNLAEGDTLELSIGENGEITVVPMVQIPANQKWFWSDEWQEGEQEADENIQSGNVRSFDKVEDALEWLDSDEAEQWANGD